MVLKGLKITKECNILVQKLIEEVAKENIARKSDRTKWETKQEFEYKIFNIYKEMKEIEKRILENIQLYEFIVKRKIQYK